MQVIKNLHPIGQINKFGIMTDKLLDALLKSLRTNRNKIDLAEVERKNRNLFSKDGWEGALTLLLTRKFIKIYRDLSIPPVIAITLDGLKFLEHGGFKHETKLKNRPLKANLIA